MVVVQRLTKMWDTYRLKVLTNRTFCQYSQLACILLKTGSRLFSMVICYSPEWRTFDVGVCTVAVPEKGLKLHKLNLNNDNISTS